MTKRSLLIHRFLMGKGVDGAPHDSAWISSLARGHARRLAGVAKREGLSGEDALDAVQDALSTFLGLPQARSLAGKPEEAAAMLTTIVRNASRNLRRRHHRAKPHHALKVIEEIEAELPSADAILASEEERARLASCLDSLEETQRRVVTLRALEELSGLEVAAQLGLAPNHVAVLLYRAKKELFRCVTA